MVTVSHINYLNNKMTHIWHFAMVAIPCGNTRGVVGPLQAVVVAVICSIWQPSVEHATSRQPCRAVVATPQAKGRIGGGAWATWGRTLPLSTNRLDACRLKLLS